jgi:CRP-like cAMP-binding protein
VIQSGSASVTSGGKILTALGPGDFFGEIALLRQGVRTATVTASSLVGLIVMLGSDFRVFERSFPGASAAMRTRWPTDWNDHDGRTRRNDSSTIGGHSR